MTITIERDGEFVIIRGNGALITVVEPGEALALAARILKLSAEASALQSERVTREIEAATAELVGAQATRRQR